MLGCTGTRTTTSAVNFTRPFRLGKDPRELPPGVYVLHTLEEVYEGAFAPLRLAVSVDFEVPEPGGKEIRVVRPQELAEALERNRAPDEMIA